MNPNPWSEATSTLTQEPKAPGRAVRVFDTVKVAPETFSSIMFMSAAARREFVQGQRLRDEDKPQKRNAEGVPLWSVQLAAVNWRGKSELITVTIPMHDDPLYLFQAGMPVRLSGLVFGVSPKRDGGGFVTWCSADGIEPATATSGKAA